MSVFLNNIPQPADYLSNSQPQLLGNNGKLDSSFGTDHVQFSSLAPSNGMHTSIHTVQQSGHPTVTATLPQIYAMEDSSNVGVIDYSRGWQSTQGASAAPTPLTNLQSISTGLTILPAATTSILNFAGLARAIVTVYAIGNIQTGAQAYFAGSAGWNGTTLFTMVGGSATGMGLSVSGSTLQLLNTSPSANTLSNVYWSLVMHRLQ